MLNTFLPMFLSFPFSPPKFPLPPTRQTSLPSCQKYMHDLRHLNKIQESQVRDSLLCLSLNQPGIVVYYRSVMPTGLCRASHKYYCSGNSELKSSPPIEMKLFQMLLIQQLFCSCSFLAVLLIFMKHVSQFSCQFVQKRRYSWDGNAPAMLALLVLTLSTVRTLVKIHRQMGSLQEFWVLCSDKRKHTYFSKFPQLCHYLIISISNFFILLFILHKSLGLHAIFISQPLYHLCS